MEDITQLMFRREHFPGPVRDFEQVAIPPFHELIQKEGIDVALAASTIIGSLEDALLDLKDAHMYPNKTTEEKPYRVVKVNSNGVTVSFPHFFNTLYVGKDRITDGGECALYLWPRRGSSSIYVPVSVTFDPQLLQEYSMTEREGPPGYKLLECILGWRPHNVDDNNLRIILKNVVIGIDNAVVRKKYSK